MSIATQTRAKWIQERIEQAYAAAANGDGWIALGKLWGASNASALQWCQQRIPPEICNKIGENGRASRAKDGDYRKYEYLYSKPVMGARPVSEPRRYQTCQHMFWTRSKGLHACGAETRDCKPTCEDCKRLELTGPVGSRFHSIRSHNKWSHMA